MIKSLGIYAWIKKNKIQDRYCCKNMQLEKNLWLWKSNLVTKNAHSRMKEFATGTYIKIIFLLLLVFLLKKLFNPPFFLNRKLSNFLYFFIIYLGVYY